MAKSDFVFEDGDGVDVGLQGEHDSVFVEGGSLTDTGLSTFVFEQGTGIGGDFYEGFEDADAIDDWVLVDGDGDPTSLTRVGDKSYEDSHSAYAEDDGADNDTYAYDPGVPIGTGMRLSTAVMWGGGNPQVAFDWGWDGSNDYYEVELSSNDQDALFRIDGNKKNRSSYDVDGNSGIWHFITVEVQDNGDVTAKVDRQGASNNPVVTVSDTGYTRSFSTLAINVDDAGSQVTYSYWDAIQKTSL